MEDIADDQTQGILSNRIEPHADLLRTPPADQGLFKMMSVENLIRSITDSYLHFNRVDSYADFPGADPHDGEQLTRDRTGNARSIFQKAPGYTAADYFNTSRARTYACCFSLESSDFIWKNYAMSNDKGKVCVEFNFARLRERLNKTLKSDGVAMVYKGQRCQQIFDINYGIINYIDWNTHQSNTKYLANPIEYTYFKDKRYSDERELRISLSALGVGHFVLADHTKISFPPSLQMTFDFREAITDGTIQQFHTRPDCNINFLQAALKELGIMPA